MSSLGVYLARHYASAPIGDEKDDKVSDFVCGCILLVLALAVLIAAAIVFYAVVFLT